MRGDPKHDLTRTIRQSARFLGGILLLATLLGGCSPGGLFSGNMMWAPHRAVETDAAMLQSALTELAEGDRAGRITLTEEQLSSLLRATLTRHEGQEGTVSDVQVWLEPDTVYLKVLLREGAVPLIPTETALNLEGALRTVDGRLQFELRRAGVGVLSIVSPALLDAIESQLNVAVRSLLDRTSPLHVDVDTGVIAIDVP